MSTHKNSDYKFQKLNIINLKSKILKIYKSKNLKILQKKKIFFNFIF